MARYEEKHLIIAPKIHRLRIALNSWGKKRRRGPRTEKLSLPPGWELEESSVTFLKTLKLRWPVRGIIHGLSPSSQVWLTPCPAKF